MRKRTRAALATLVAAAALTASLGTAGARELSVSETGFRFTWSPITFNLGAFSLECPMTLSGSFRASTLAKQSLTKIGDITTASSGTCTGGTLTVLTETLPWEVKYASFSGTLPNITAVRLKVIRVALRATVEGIGCLFGTTATEPAFGELQLSGSEVASFRLDETRTIRLGGGFICSLAGTSNFSGTASVTDGEGRTLNITLIPGIQVTPSPVEFGTVEPESTTRRTVTIEAIEVGATVRAISVRNGTNFSITDPNGCRGSRIASGGRCDFRVIFEAPNTEGRSYEDSVTVETDVGNRTVTVRGRTRDPVAPTISPSPVAFGTVAVESLSRRAVTITAVSAVTIRGISLEVARYFAIIDPNRCASASLAREARCTFNVIAEAPAERGVAMRDTLVIENSIEQRRVTVEATT